jgi:hypothetical protein
MVEQQVDKDAPRIVKYLKTDTAHREIDLHPDVAEFLRRYMAGKRGLLLHTRRYTQHLYGNLEDRWLTPRLAKMGLDFRSKLSLTTSKRRILAHFVHSGAWARKISQLLVRHNAVFVGHEWEPQHQPVLVYAN